MKKLCGTFLSLLIILSMLMMCIPVSFAAEEETIVDFSVTERNGVAVTDFLVRRGIPFARGRISADTVLQVVNKSTGAQQLTQNKVLTRYEDGSVKWMMIAFVTNLQPNEVQNYRVSVTQKPRTDTKLICSSDNGKVNVNTGKLKVTFDTLGIAGIEYNSTALLKDIGASSVCEENESLCPFSGSSVQILEQGPVYTTVQVSAPYLSSVMRAEQTYTVYNNSAKISAAYRYTSYNGTRAGTDIITSLYEKYNLVNGFSQITYSDVDLKSDGEEKRIYSCTSATAYNSQTDISFAVASHDVDRYRYATSKMIGNGFTYEDGALLFAPILYNMPFEWWDGLNRTAHCDILISTGKNYAENEVKTQTTSPAIVIEPSVYAEAGMIDTASVSAIAQQQIDAVKWTKDKRYGRVNAGGIPFTLDPQHDSTGNYSVRPGGVEYNIWCSYMASQDPDIFDIVNESTEDWADTEIYEGVIQEARGGGRYRIMSTGNGLSTHPYYSEFSLLYMAYCMTGNEYYKTSMKEMADRIYISAMNSSASGLHIAKPLIWSESTFYIRDMTEVRYTYMARAMYYAGELFEDQRYSYIAGQISQWISDRQEPNGAWAQAYNDDGSPYVFQSVKKVLYKNYIMLYGLRGPAEYYRQTKDPVLDTTFVKFADFLLGEMQNGQWMWDPYADTSVTDTGEDFSRGEAPMQEIMAVEMLELVYEETGDRKYFDGMLKYLRYYISAAQKSGFSPQRYNAKDYLNGLINGVIAGQNTTLMRIDNKLTAVIAKNKTLAEELGFADMVDLFTQRADYDPNGVSCTYNDIDVTANLYKTQTNEWLYVCNHSGYHCNGEWEKNIDVRVKNDNYLWSDMKNTISNKFETILSRHYDVFEMGMSTKLPIQVNEFTDTVTAQVKQYDSEAIIIDATGVGNSAVFTVENGIFPVIQGQRYYVSVQDKGREKTIVITVGDGNGNTVCENGKLQLTLNFSGSTIQFDDLYNHWANSDVTAMTLKGLVSGVGNNEFAPDADITLREFVLLVMRSLGIDDKEAVSSAHEYGFLEGDFSDKLNEPISREQMFDIAMRVLRYKRSDTATLGIHANTFLIPQRIVDDDEAVNADLAQITLADYNPYTANLSLPAEGMYDSKIIWSSSDETVISSNGNITRPHADETDKEVTLTAVASRGKAQAEKSFSLMIPNASYVDINTVNNGNVVLQDTGDAFDFTFDVVRTAVDDCVIGHMNTAVTYTSYSDIPIIVRFGVSGCIDAYNKNGYFADTNVPYALGKTYTVHIYGAMSAGSYSVDVTDEDENTYQIAKNYIFRSTAKSMPSVNNVIMGGSKTAKITRHSLAKEKTLYGGGLQSAEQYFGITIADVPFAMTDKAVYFSTEPSVLTPEGKLLQRPKETETVSIWSVPGEEYLYRDILLTDAKYQKSMMEAYLLALAKGDNGYLHPKAYCTRAESVTILRRLCDLYEVGHL